MFEKEADEMAVNNAKKIYGLEGSVCMNIQECAYVNGFQDGAEFGYNKVNEWHYPSKGELPKEETAKKETLYLLWFGHRDYMTGVFSHGRFWCFDSGWFETNEVIAWKEIVLPDSYKVVKL